MADPMLLVNELSVSFGQRLILDKLCLTIPGPGLYALMGPGGVGKSTLLKTLAGVTQGNPNLHVSGQILLAGQPLSSSHHATLVEQHPRMSLSSVRDVLVQSMPDRASLTWAEQDQQLQHVLRSLELEHLLPLLQEELLTLETHQQRLIVLAKAIIAKPQFLCVDEPTAGLEDEQAKPLLSLLDRLSAKLPILWISHHQRRVRQYAQITALLAAGQIWCWCETADFFERPVAPLGLQFVGTGGYELSWPTSPEVELIVEPELITEPILLPEVEPAIESTDTTNITPAAGGFNPVSAATLHLQDLKLLHTLFPESLKHYPRDSVGPVGFHWLVPGRLAGCPRPGIVMDIDLDLGALCRTGVKRLITLEEEPLEHPQVQVRGITQVHFPIVDMEAPSIEQAIALFKSLDSWLQAPAGIAFHCKAGLGRTGTMLVAALIWRGAQAQAALELARRIFNGWVQSDEQIDFLHSFELALRAQVDPSTISSLEITH